MSSPCTTHTPFTLSTAGKASTSCESAPPSPTHTATTQRNVLRRTERASPAGASGGRARRHARTAVGRPAPIASLLVATAQPRRRVPEGDEQKMAGRCCAGRLRASPALIAQHRVDSLALGEFELGCAGVIRTPDPAGASAPRTRAAELVVQCRWRRVRPQRRGQVGRLNVRTASASDPLHCLF